MKLERTNLTACPRLRRGCVLQTPAGQPHLSLVFDRWVPDPKGGLRSSAAFTLPLCLHVLLSSWDKVTLSKTTDRSNPRLEIKHMKRVSTIAIVAALLLAANLSMAQTPQGASPDPAIVEKLREIVTIRQRLVESNKRAVQSGVGEADSRYEVALGEARLMLARELGERDDEIAALKDLLKVQQSRLEEAKKKAAAGGLPIDEVDKIRVAVLEAEVRLLRAQKNSSKQ